MVYVGIFLFHGNMLAPYRKIEMLELLMFSFRIVQNFRPNSRPLNSGLEKNALHIWIQNDLSFSKLFEIWKSDKKWQLNNPNKRTQVLVLTTSLVAFPCWNSSVRTFGTLTCKWEVKQIRRLNYTYFVRETCKYVLLLLKFV